MSAEQVQAAAPRTPVTQVTSSTPFPERLWAGTEDSLAVAQAAYAQLISAGTVYKTSQQEDTQDAPYNYSLQDNIGVISIRGPLLNSDSKYARYYGATTYNDIRDAAIYAAQDPNAKGILLDIDSGGGAVSGMLDTAGLLALIDKQVKPVHSYTSGTMASAAYGLGVAGRSVHASQTSVVGSIGVLAVHRENSQMMKDMGIGVTVMRSGKYKALVNSDEPLTDPAKAQLQQQLDSTYGVFANWVADQLGTTVTLVDQNMAQGREFLGQAAVDVGLVASIETFDSMVNKISKTLDNNLQSQNNSNNFSRGQNMKQALTETQIAAVQAGINLAADAGSQEPGAQGSGAAAVSQSAATEVTEVEDKNQTTQTIAFLRDERDAAQTKSIQLGAALDAEKARSAGFEATNKSLALIVSKSVTQMKVALGLSAIDLSAMTPEALLAEHSATAETFTKSFHGGGVAAVATENPDAKNVDVVDPNWAAKVKATRSI